MPNLHAPPEGPAARVASTDAEIPGRAASAGSTVGTTLTPRRRRVGYNGPSPAPSRREGCKGETRPRAVGLDGVERDLVIPRVTEVPGEAGEP